MAAKPLHGVFIILIFISLIIYPAINGFSQGSGAEKPGDVTDSADKTITKAHGSNAETANTADDGRAASSIKTSVADREIYGKGYGNIFRKSCDHDVRPSDRNSSRY